MSRDRPRLVMVLRRLDLGGAERQATMLANGFSRWLGAAVEVVSFNPGLQVPALLDPAVGHRVLHPGGDGSWFRRSLHLVEFITTLRRLRPDLLLPFTDFPNKVVGAVWPATGAAGCVWNQRDEGREVTGGPLERLALKQVGCFVANSEVGRLHLRRSFAVPEQMITVIHNGVQLPAPVHDRQAWRRRLQVEDNTVVACMVAHLHRFKDHETLVHAWRRVVDRAATPCLLVLAGERGNTASRIEALINELQLQASVRLLDRIDDVSGLLAACELAVFSSRLEGCPNAVLEAMTCGLPVVATEIVGTLEALGDDCPMLVPEADPQALADAVIRLAAAPERRAELGEVNRARADKLFTPEAAVAAYASLFVRLGVLPASADPSTWR